MWYMFMMNHRMTIRANYQQIRQFVVMSIFINMMNPQNVFTFIKATFLTFFKETSANHVFANRAKNCFPGFLAFFIYACFRAVFTGLARRIKENFMTMITFIFNRIIVMGFFANNGFKPSRLSRILCKFRSARPGASNGSFCPIRQNFEDFTTMLTC